jgi:formate hydrogenlyase subunit 3/multisubunit Na+/H+ antiporter MnhD subunit
MTPGNLLVPILLPMAVAVIVFLIPRKTKIIREAVAVVGSLAGLYYSFTLFPVKSLTYKMPWLGRGIDFDLRLYHFAGFNLLAIFGFLFLITGNTTAMSS